LEKLKFPKLPCTWITKKHPDEKDPTELSIVQVSKATSSSDWWVVERKPNSLEKLKFPKLPCTWITKRHPGDGKTLLKGSHWTIDSSRFKSYIQFRLMNCWKETNRWTQLRLAKISCIVHKQYDSSKIFS